MFSLTMRMFFIIGALFGMVYLLVSMIGQQGFLYNLTIAGIILLFQYLLSPIIVDFTMKVKYVSEEEEPELHKMVEELAERAGIPKPKVGISELPIANAFAYGRTIRDGRIAVTRQIMQILSKEELRAVLGHEISHIKNRDMLVITLVSVIPMILYYLYNLVFISGLSGGSNNKDSSNLGPFIGMFLFLLYFISNLLVLALSRIREYFADYGSVKLGNPPEHLASALYKLVYNSALLSSEKKEQISGAKAFFINDPDVAEKEIYELSQIDINRDYKIDRSELEMLKRARVKISLTEKMMELLTTHPNMLKRIKKLSEYI